MPEPNAPLLTWWHDFAMVCAWEVPMSALARLVPARLQPIEVRPGVGLFLINTAHYLDGIVEGVPAHYELALNVMCQPDLRVDMPTPNLTFFTPRITSTSAAFLEHARDVDHFEPYFASGLRAELARDRARVAFWDDDGLIVELYSTHPQPVFETTTIWGQYYTEREGVLRLGKFQWVGTMFEHQRPEPCARFNREHPIWGGLDLGGAAERTYLQMIGPPDALHATVFETIGEVGQSSG